jgi:LysM repeat protein
MTMRRSILLVGLVVTLLVWLMPSLALAQGGSTYVVQPGDTLAAISARYGMTLAQLAAANGLSWNSWVYVGQRLVIPGVTEAPTAPVGGTYVVQPGDTLVSIAARHGTTVAALMAANGLANANFIYVGQRLVIPGGTGAPGQPAPTPVPAPTAPPYYGARWIDVNLSMQTLTAYSGQSPVFQTLVSTGLPGTPTVVGTFRIYAKYTATLMTGPGYYLPNVPWVMYFHRGYSLHGTYWHSNFGQPMSHGCVNLSVADAQWLFNWADVGTPVVTHY